MREYFFPPPESTNAEIVDELNKVIQKTDVNSYLDKWPSYIDYFRVN
jgi:hypothetical protein